MMTFLANTLREIVTEFSPYLGYHFASRTSGHSLPPERSEVGVLRTKHDRHRKSTRNTCHQARYLSTWKMTRLLSSEFPIHHFPKRRTTAWEFMGQEVPERYLQLLNNFPNERRHPEACDDACHMGCQAH